MRPLVLLSSLATGGAERVTVSFLSRLAADGSQAAACTVTRRHDGPLAAELERTGLRRYDLGARRLADPVSLLRLLQLLRRQGIDLIHAHGQDASILASVAASILGVPLVITRHVLNEPTEDWRQRLRARWALSALRRADAVVAVSESVADHLAHIGCLSRSAVQVIPNGVEVERFHVEGAARARLTLRQALNVSREERLIVVPAVLRPGKGHELLLEALPHIRAQVPSVRVAFAGAGERERELRWQARSQGSAVMFLGHRQDIPELLAASDLVVLPSLEEAFPTVLLEAAAAGRPVVATAVGGAVEVVENGRTGLLVPPADVGALAEAVVLLLTDEQRAEDLGRAAQLHTRRRYSIDLQLRRTLALWSEVLEQRVA